MKFHCSLVGQWYLRRDTYEMLQVLDYDEEAGTISVQNFDGDLDQFDDECWRGLSRALGEHFCGGGDVFRHRTRGLRTRVGRRSMDETTDRARSCREAVFGTCLARSRIATRS